ncbi:MAG: hypothetical protein ABIB04_01480 [Patescibacteria group bacterium]
MAQAQSNVFNPPCFSPSGRKVSLRTPILRHTLIPLGHPAIEVEISNVPAMRDGLYVTFGQEELQRPLNQSDATIGHPYMAELLQGKRELIEYKTRVRFNYGNGNVADPKAILASDVLDGQHLSGPRNALKNGRADVIVIQPLESPEEWPEEGRSRYVEIDSFALRRLELDLATNFKLFQSLGPRRFVALVGESSRPDQASRGIQFQVTWVVFGIWPREEYKPEADDDIWTNGRGVIFMVSVDVGDLIVNSMIRYMLGMHAEWLSMHPIHERAAQVDEEETDSAPDEVVAADEEDKPRGKKAPKKGKANRRERRAQRREQAEDMGTLGELLASKGQELPVLGSVVETDGEAVIAEPVIDTAASA